MLVAVFLFACWHLGLDIYVNCCSCKFMKRKMHDDLQSGHQVVLTLCSMLVPMVNSVKQFASGTCAFQAIDSNCLHNSQ